MKRRRFGWAGWDTGARRFRPACLALLLSATLLPGCLQIQRTITLQNDGSGTLVEEIRLEDHLLAMAKGSKDLAALTDCLKKQRLAERMSQFGAVTMVSYETQERDGVVCAGKAVFSFTDINDVTIPAFPNRSPNWPSQVIRFHLYPPVVVIGGYYGFATHFKMPLVVSLEPEPKAARAKEPKVQEDAQTPREKEKLRSLLPALRAMLKGFQWNLTLEAFGSVGGKDSVGTSKRHVLFDVRDRDLDDDETLLTVLQWNQSPNEHFAWDEKLGLADGRVLNTTRTLMIGLNSPAAQLEPTNPLRGADGTAASQPASGPAPTSRPAGPAPRPARPPRRTR